MSGGSARYDRFDRQEYQEKLKQLDDVDKRSKYDEEIIAYLQGILKDFNDRNVEAINKHLEVIREALNKDEEFVGDMRLIFGGSISKNTYLEGLSDIDALIILNDSELKNKNPKEVLKHFKEVLDKRLPSTVKEVGDKSITLRYGDVDVQLLPAIKYQTGIKIASNLGDSWSNLIKPTTFSRLLTTTNKRLDNKLVPTIKLVKAMISKVPENKQITGYHTEAIAVDVFSNYNGQKNVKDMVSHFFKSASSILSKPMRDSTGQSNNLDEYLGGRNDLKRKLACDSIDRIHRNIKTANQQMMNHYWRNLIN